MQLLPIALVLGSALGFAPTPAPHSWTRAPLAAARLRSIVPDAADAAAPASSSPDADGAASPGRGALAHGDDAAAASERAAQAADWLAAQGIAAQGASVEQVRE